MITEERLLEYWRAEQTAPRWYRLSNEIDDVSDEAYLQFCKEHRIYEIEGCALLFCKLVTPKIVNIHFSVLRGQKVDLVPGLTKIRDELFDEGVEIIHGWVWGRNRPLKRLCNKLGLYWNGLEAKEPEYRQCFAIHRYSVRPPTMWQKLCLSFRQFLLRFS